MNAEKSVSQIMTREVITVRSEDTLSKVKSIFEENRIHHLIVKDNNGVCGVISKNDILEFLLQNYNGPEQISMTTLTAREVMTANPLTVDVDDTIGLAADIILSNRLHSLPVVEDGDLAGILTNHDLLKYCFR